VVRVEVDEPDAVDGTGAVILLSGGWPEPTVNPANASENAAATPLNAATVRSRRRRLRFRVAELLARASEPGASATGWPKSRDVKISSSVL
jgi:hypothetical protein